MMACALDDTKADAWSTTMKGYVDAFFLSLPKKKLKEYREMAAFGGKIWMEHGALQYVESTGDDLKGMPGCLGFTQLSNIKRGDIPVFSWILYRSKAHRNAVNKKVFADKRMIPGPNGDMPFELKRMAYGGFKTMVNRRRKS